MSARLSHVVNESYTLYSERRFVIECPAPSTTIFLAMKNSIIFISALSLAAMMLASCSSVFAPDETATTGVTSQTNETAPSAKRRRFSQFNQWWTLLTGFCD